MAIERGTWGWPVVELVCGLAATGFLLVSVVHVEPQPAQEHGPCHGTDSVQLRRLEPRSPSNEARVRAVLDKAFETAPGVVAPYQLACDESRCSLGVDEALVDPAWWTARFEEHAPRAGIGVLFGHFGPGRADFDAQAPGITAGYRWMEDVMDAVDESAEVDACARRSTAPGKVTLVLEPNLASRTSRVSINGALPGSPLASCLEGAVAEILRRNPMPAGMTYAWKEIPIPVRVR